jgi:7-cyano-7-deazaguanine synthase
MNDKKKAVCLLSAGLDSTMTLALTAHADEVDVILALTINYGQRAAAQEISHARAIAKHYDVPHQVVELPWFSDLLPDAFKAKSASHWQQADKTTDAFYEAKPVWVPNRNGVLLNVAAAYAEANEANVVLFGGNAEEAQRFPDNTVEFQQAITQSLSFSTLNKVEVHCPVQTMTKADMIATAKGLAVLNKPVPLEHIWSCYGDASDACGNCPSCVRLKTALSQHNHPLADTLFATAV